MVVSVADAFEAHSPTPPTLDLTSTAAALDVISSVSLISDATMIALTTLGAAGGIWLVLCRARWYTRFALPLAITIAVLASLILYYVVEKVWRPFPDPMAIKVYVAIAAGLVALFLLVPRAWAARRLGAKVLSLLAALCVLLTSSAHVNSVFAAYPTIGTVFGVEAAERISLDQLPPRQRPAPGTAGPLDQSWKPPESLPSTGRLMSTDIPATLSGFRARAAEIYLPPSYFAEPRPALPVVVLLAGQPGKPKDWLNGGKLAETMNAFAQGHAGLAPIVVVADSTGSTLANPLCVNSSLGNVDTYLAQDVPRWVKSALQVNTDPRAWTIAGLSSGGTCSIQLATNHPDVYPAFLNLSGQLEPTLGDRSRTLSEAFGGDEAAFAAINPLNLLKTRKYPDSGGIFVVGTDDHDYKSGQRVLHDAAKAAGMDVRYVEVPGGHSFAVWSEGFRKHLPWLMQKVGLIS